MSAAVLGVVAWVMLSQPMDLSELTRQFSESEKQYDLAMSRTLVEIQRTAIDSSTPTPHRQVYAASLLLRAQLAAFALERVPSTDEVERTVLRNEAVESARECLGQTALLPESPETLRMQADAFAELARVAPLAPAELEQWRAAVERALAQNPDNPRVQVAAARYWLGNGQSAKALEHVTLALKLNPILESALITRALALEASGRQEEAISAWRQLIEHNPAAPPGNFAAQPGAAAPAEVSNQPLAPAE